MTTTIDSQSTGAPARVADAEGGASLEKVRDLLFGVQMRDYDRKFARLEERLAKDTSDLRDEVKKRLVTSRVDGARVLVDAFSKVGRPPRVFVSASGVGFYGGRVDDALMNESSPPGDDFLANLCVQWEAAVRAAEAHGARVAIVVQHRQGVRRVRFGPRRLARW